jgi:hypothetical protein
MKIMMGNISQVDTCYRQTQEWPQKKNNLNDRLASHTSTETTALLTTSTAATWTSSAAASPTPAENTIDVNKRPFSGKSKSKKDNADDIDFDNIPNEIFVVVNVNDVDVEDDANPFRFDAVSPDVTVSSTTAASYPDAESTAVRRNSSPAAGSPFWTRQRQLDLIPQMPLPLSLRHRQHQRHAVASTADPDPWMFRAAPLRRSSCPYYLGGRESRHSLHLLQQKLMLPSIQLSSSEGDRSDINTMTTLEIVGKAIEIAEAAVEQMEEHQQDQLRHLSDDDDDGDDDDDDSDDGPETKAIGASSSAAAATTAAAAITRVDRFMVLDVPPKAPRRKASSGNLLEGM